MDQDHRLSLSCDLGSIASHTYYPGGLHVGVITRVRTRGAGSWQTTPRRATEGTCQCISGGPASVLLGSRSLGLCTWAGARVCPAGHSTQWVLPGPLPVAAPSPAPAQPRLGPPVCRSLGIAHDGQRQRPAWPCNRMHHVYTRPSHKYHIYRNHDGTFAPTGRLAFKFVLAADCSEIARHACIWLPWSAAS